MTTLCVLPARYGSQRLPAKPLALINGTPMIVLAARNAQKMGLFHEVLVATDHEAILSVCEQAGISAVMTPVDCPSGTDRIRHAVQGRAGDLIVNIQGDEPAMPRQPVERAIASLVDSGADVATACVPIFDEERFLDPNVVKVVRSLTDRALYFSRSPIPSLVRRDEPELRKPGYLFGYKHLGLYIYRRAALDRFCTLSTTLLERQEKLEQLRMLENGFHIQCITAETDSVGVDVHEDLLRVAALLGQPGAPR